MRSFILLKGYISCVQTVFLQLYLQHRKEGVMSAESENRYIEGESILSEAGLYASVSDTYGIVVGMIAGGIKVEDPQFLSLAVQLLNDGDEISEVALAWMRNVATEAVNAILEDEAIDFLIPADDMPLRDRAHALAEFAHSFLTGFSCKQKNHAKLSNDLQELLKDVVNIANIDEDIPEGDEQEKDFMLLQEHCSLAVKYAFEECAAMLYPKQTATQFVIEDDEDEGCLVELSEKRCRIHEEEEALWEKQTRLASRRK